MKDILRNPNAYFVIVPVAVAIWAVSVMAWSLPAAEKSWVDEQTEYETAKQLLNQILSLDPDRLNYKKAKGSSKEFDYADVVESYAKQQGIPPKNFQVTSRKPMKKKGETVQSADMTIATINIERLAGFLSRILSQWPGLECSKLNLTKLKTGKDAWKVTLKFTYTY